MAEQKPNKTLIDVVIATLAGSFLYTIPLQHSQLLGTGLVEVNKAIVDPNNKNAFATRATQAGIDMVNAWNAEQSMLAISQGVDPVPAAPAVVDPVVDPTPAPVVSAWGEASSPAVVTTPVTKSLFALEDNVPVPTVSARTKGGNTTYPFDAMNVGQSFFVPDANGKKAAKTMASTVSGANLRNSVEVAGQVRTNRKGAVVPLTEQTKLFIVKSVVENGIGGARIWRTK
jgi:hypothetical protein